MLVSIPLTFICNDCHDFVSEIQFCRRCTTTAHSQISNTASSKYSTRNWKQSEDVLCSRLRSSETSGERTIELLISGTVVLVIQSSADILPACVKTYAVWIPQRDMEHGGALRRSASEARGEASGSDDVAGRVQVFKSTPTGRQRSHRDGVQIQQVKCTFK